MQSLLQERNKTRYLPGPIFRSRPFICLGCFPMSPGVLHVVIGLTDFPVGLALTALGFVDVMHYIGDSAVQFVQRMRGALGKESSVPSFRRGAMVSRSCVVRAMFVRVMLFRLVVVGVMLVGMMLVRLVVIRAMSIRMMIFGAPVPACLCKLL
jgi:hypothetical protein